MRISVREGDLGHVPWLRLKRDGRVMVRCNGGELARVVTADTELGWALCYATDREGRMILSRPPGREPEVVTFEVWGRIEIEVQTRDPGDPHAFIPFSERMELVRRAHGPK